MAHTRNIIHPSIQMGTGTVTAMDIAAMRTTIAAVSHITAITIIIAITIVDIAILGKTHIEALFPIDGSLNLEIYCI